MRHYALPTGYRLNLMGCPWTAHGLSMGYHVKCVDYPRATHGLPTGYPRATHGQILKYHGLRTSCPWAIHGLSIGTLGRPMGSTWCLVVVPWPAHDVSVVAQTMRNQCVAHE